MFSSLSPSYCRKARADRWKIAMGRRATFPTAFRCRQIMKWVRMATECEQLAEMWLEVLVDSTRFKNIAPR
eukprot:6214638-Pleurochrysis_carterae.AAC.10